MLALDDERVNRRSSTRLGDSGAGEERSGRNSARDEACPHVDVGVFLMS